MLLDDINNTIDDVVKLSNYHLMLYQVVSLALNTKVLSFLNQSLVFY